MSLLAIPSGTSSNASGFYPKTINGSLRFNDDDNAYLSRTPASASNQKTWTWSGWVKRGNLGAFTRFFTAKETTSNGESVGLRFDSSDRLDFIFCQDGSSSITGRLITTQVFRDASAWYHIVFVQDTTDSDGDKMRLWVNGSEVTQFDTETNMTTNHDGYINKNVEHRVGAESHATSQTFDGYLAEVHFIDGTAYDADDFGELKNGVWVPKKPSVTYGTNGFYLEFAGNANDSSGNGNNWTANNIGSWDYVPDSPTNNFCTLNPLQSTKSATLREGNLELLNGANDQASVGTFGITSGKWYWEVYYPTNDCPEVGVMPIDQNLSGRSTVGSGNVDGLARITNGTTMRTVSFATVDNTGLTTQTSAGAVRVVLDADNGKLWVSDNDGTYPNSGNPETGANPQATFDSDWVFQTEGVYPFALVATGSSEFCIFNFGQDSTFTDQTTSGGNSDENGHGDFKYSVPSGYLALCTANLSLNTAIDLAEGGSPQDYFNTVLYVGNNSTQSIGTVGFAPDWIWAKNRDTTGYHHELYDRTRGDNLRLFTSQTDAEITGYLQFDSDGFNLTSGGGINNNTDDHVAWNWRANGAGTSVTFTTTGGTGSISGTRSVNTDIGFSLITYTSASSDPGETRIAHGLGVAPKFHLIKCIDATSDGAVYHYKNGTGKMEIVNSNAYDSGWNGYNGAHPNSTYISLNWQTQADGSYRDVNEQSREYVMYAFAEVEGFSKIGMYTDAYVDDYTTDSPFVYCGFRPAWVMIKSTSASRDWIIADNKRNTSNVITNYLRPNNNNNTFTGANLLMDFMANGFKIRGGDGAINTTGESYIFIAFAENPFKYANAR